MIYVFRSVDLNTSNSFSSTSSATKLLKICHLNSHSINNKSTIIKDYVVETDVDVMALTETRLTPDCVSDFTIRDIIYSQSICFSAQSKDKSWWWWCWTALQIFSKNGKTESDRDI